MSKSRIKICGITSLADARFCAGAGTDYLGFIQYEQSPRYIAPSEAKEIIEWLHGPESVGVFVNETADVINEIVSDTGFHVAQVHGEMSAKEIAEIECKSIRALAVAPATTGDELRRQMDAYMDAVDYFLLDTAKAGMHGGTGETFNWDVAQQLTASYPVFIAGGLNAAIIGDVINKLHPFGIDLSSSVESSPGVKDFDKLTNLFDVFNELKTPEST